MTSCYHSFEACLFANLFQSFFQSGTGALNPLIALEASDLVLAIGGRMPQQPAFAMKPTQRFIR